MSRTVRLDQIAYARSGDKGDDSNIGIWAKKPAGYDILRETLTEDRVTQWLSNLGTTQVTRYELPNLRALNFILSHSLAGGGSGSIRTDAQGKLHARGLLFMEVEVPDDFEG